MTFTAKIRNELQKSSLNKTLHCAWNRFAAQRNTNNNNTWFRIFHHYIKPRARYQRLPLGAVGSALKLRRNSPPLANIHLSPPPCISLSLHFMWSRVVNRAWTVFSPSHIAISSTLENSPHGDLTASSASLPITEQDEALRAHFISVSPDGKSAPRFSNALVVSFKTRHSDFLSKEQKSGQFVT